MKKEQRYSNYRSYISENNKEFFNFTKNHQELLLDIYNSIDDFYVINSLYDDDTKNYFNLNSEMVFYSGRLMILLPINDKYIIDALFRLLVEKLYRLFYCLNSPNMLESNIRKKNRESMSKRVNIADQNDLEDLYKEFSILIHHTDKMPSDSFNFRELLNYSDEVMQHTLKTFKKLHFLYFSYFVKETLKIENLSDKLYLDANLSETAKGILEINY